MPSESPPKVCNSYAQTGSCRFGSQCKFAHVERVSVTSNNNKKRRRVERVNVTNNNNKKRKTNLPTKRSGTQTPLDNFFAKYPEFEYNSSASASLEFNRMRDEHSWDDEEREKAYHDFKDAIVHQFNHFYGTDADNLTSWRTLCQIVQVSPIPDTLESCREAVKATHVNIVDLIDAGVTEGPVRVFVSEVALSEYTKTTRKFFPRDNVHAGGLLKYLLRRIMNPRPERRVSESGRKKQSRRKR
ncbi:uncharacterized protein EDB91DRAFT_1253656 [Suillus paluster]|uniref:uncharacterized protein n=1 Tax=Suillus paluster TaxID=48578 RepID=UPI001B86A810|nr:uncharacterized protein EDB91DRAFT_1253656 [Suillus paluster]KAG1728066.1 hypothetical protein EDB91DRAFT_1253656 [Suillus paluster]